MSLSLYLTPHSNNTDYQPSLWWIVVSILLAVGGGVLFYAAYLGTKGYGMFAHYDPIVQQWVTAHRDSTLTTVMEVITHSFAPLILVGVSVVLATAWCVYKKEVWRPLLLVGAIGALSLIASYLKNVVARSRPPSANMVPPLEIDFSFPSGHTIGIAISLLVLGYLFYSRRLSFSHVAAWALITIAAVAIIAFSRLYLGYHWLSDVSASFALALICLALVIAVDWMKMRWMTTRSTR